MNSNITSLVLKGSPFPTITIQEIAEQIKAKKKCQIKLPTFYNQPNIYYPNTLNIEQTSSEITANYKANLVNGTSLIDITGGFGVDSLFFSKKTASVTHCELNENLSKIAHHNFKILNIKNIQTLATNGIDFVINNSKKYNWIYADPSRRNSQKNKVFLLKDCTPNIPEILDELFKKSNHILLKIAPMLDISNAIQELKFVKNIHIVAVNNEVKELLFVLEKDTTKAITLKTINIEKHQNQEFSFLLHQQENATYGTIKKYLYEPNAAILKSGAFQHISKVLKVDKLHQHSHLYTSNNLVNFPGRSFEVLQHLPYQKKMFKKLQLHKANISTRNFPESVAQIRKKLNIKDGGDAYIFFTTNCENKKIVIICKKLIA